MTGNGKWRFSPCLVADEEGLPHGIDNLGNEAGDRSDAFDQGEQTIDEAEVSSGHADDGVNGRHVGKKFAPCTLESAQFTMSTGIAYECGPYCRVVQMTPDKPLRSRLRWTRNPENPVQST